MLSVLIESEDCCTNNIHFDGLVEVFGVVRADIVCKKLLIGKEGSVIGDIIIEALIIEDGGTFHGRVRMPLRPHATG